MRMNEINLFKVGAWLYFVGLGLILLCGLIPELPADPIAEIVSWIWAISITMLLSNFINKIIIRLRKRKKEPEENKEGNDV